MIYPRSSGAHRLGRRFCRRLAILSGAPRLGAQHLHLVDDDLGRVPAQPVLTIPLVTAQPALGIDQLATGQELLADRGQPVEADQRGIVDLLLSVSVVVLRVAVGGQWGLGEREPSRA